jgi:hypothetical protein
MRIDGGKTPIMKRDIARRADHTAFATVMEVPIENRLDGLAALMEALLNEAMKLEDSPMPQKVIADIKHLTVAASRL